MTREEAFRFSFASVAKEILVRREFFRRLTGSWLEETRRNFERFWSMWADPPPQRGGVVRFTRLRRIAEPKEEGLQMEKYMDKGMDKGMQGDGDKVGPQASGNSPDWRIRVMNAPSPTTPVGVGGMMGSEKMMKGEKMKEDYSMMKGMKKGYKDEEMAEGEY